MEIISVDKGNSTVKIGFKLKEINYLFSCVNETCNGVHIGDWEFETRIGYPRAGGEPLMDGLAEARQGLTAEPQK